MMQNQKNQLLSDFLRRLLTWLLIIVVLIAVIVPTGITVKLRSEARLALSEAKNVQLAISLLDEKSYGLGTSVYDSASRGGINSIYLSELREFADVTGTICITGWDSSTDTLESFTYQTGNYTVKYSDNQTSGKEDWSVDYNFRILSF